MLPQDVEARPELTTEHLRAEAVDLLVAAREEHQKALAGRNSAVLEAAKHLSKRRIAEVTGWDRGTITRILDAAGE